MKELGKDKEWQEMLDQSKVEGSTEPDPGLKTYQLLYDALSAEPKITVPPGFAEKVARQAGLQHNQSPASRAGVMMVAAFIMTALVCAGILLFAYPAYFKILQNYAAILVYAGLTVAAVQAADYWLIQRKHFSKVGLTA